MGIMSQPSLRELRELRQAFDLFDTDKDGTINLKELTNIMKSLGRDPSEEEIKDMINNIDLDGNQVVDFNEFLLMMGHTSTDTDKTAELKQVFAIFDKNGDGYISKSEMKAAMKKMDENFTDAEIETIISDADLDDDGEANFHEFVALMIN